jgi:hypothetical protein
VSSVGTFIRSFIEAHSVNCGENVSLRPGKCLREVHGTRDGLGDLQPCIDLALRRVGADEAELHAARTMVLGPRQKLLFLTQPRDVSRVEKSLVFF